MAKRTTDMPGSGQPQKGRADPIFWVIPRSWLVGLVALIVLPWLITGGAYYAWVSDLPDDETAGPSRPAAGDEPTVAGDPSPWGQLIVTPIVISPPLEYVPSGWGPIEKPVWRFPRTTRDELTHFLNGVGVDAGQAAAIVAAARLEPGIDGLTVTPEPSLVRALPPAVRARIYVQLAKTPLNDRHIAAYRFAGASAETWLGGAPLSPRTRQLVDPLIYRVGDFMYFADMDLVRTEIHDTAELQWLAKRLFRTATVLVRLRLDDSTDIDMAAEYWGRGGRRTDIRPLLDSVAVAGDDRGVDISHLLPTFARDHLYRYPQISLEDLEKPSFANCFWTAFNFFNASPDDRFLAPDFAIAHLKRDYYIVHDQLQLGDIVAIADSEGNYFHVAVYLADGLVFGKNGTSPLSPWTIVPMDHLKGYYVEYADDWHVTYYRRKQI